MDILKYANLKAEEFLKEDEAIAEQYDAQKQKITEEIIALGNA